MNKLHRTFFLFTLHFFHSPSPLQTDTFLPAMRLLLPQVDSGRPAYGMKEVALAKNYIDILNIAKESTDAQKLLHYRAPHTAKQVSSSTYTHAHTHMHIHTCTGTHAHTHMHRHTCTGTHAHTHMHRHTCTGTHAQAHMHIHTCTGTHAQAHMYADKPPYQW